jgi:hypothetical protein
MWYENMRILLHLKLQMLFDSKQKVLILDRIYSQMGLYKILCIFYLQNCKVLQILEIISAPLEIRLQTQRLGLSG